MSISAVLDRVLRPCIWLCAAAPLLAATEGSGTLTVTVSPKIQVKLNGLDISPAFHPDVARGSLVGLVEALRNGGRTS